MSYGCLGMFGSGGMTLGLYPQVPGRPASGLVLQLSGLGDSGRDWVEFTLHSAGDISELRDICQAMLDAMEAEEATQ